MPMFVGRSSVLCVLRHAVLRSWDEWCVAQQLCNPLAAVYVAVPYAKVASAPSASPTGTDAGLVGDCTLRSRMQL